MMHHLIKQEQLRRKLHQNRFFYLDVLPITYTFASKLVNLGHLGTVKIFSKSMVLSLKKKILKLLYPLPDGADIKV